MILVPQFKCSSEVYCWDCVQMGRKVKIAVFAFFSRSSLYAQNMEIYGNSLAFIQHTIRFLEFHNNVNKNDEHRKVQKTRVVTWFFISFKNAKFGMREN